MAPSLKPLLTLSLGLSLATLAPAQAQPARAASPSASAFAAIDIRPAVADGDCPPPIDEGLVGLHEAVLRALCTDGRARGALDNLRAELAAARAVQAERGIAGQGTLSLGREHQRLAAFDGADAQRSSGRVGSAALDLRWVLTDFGQREARERAAEQAALAAAGLRDEAVQAVMMDVVTAWHALVEAKANQSAQRAGAALMRQLLDEAGRDRHAGMEPLDLLQARNGLDRQVLAIRRADGQLVRARGELAVRMGLPPAARIDVPVPDDNAPIEAFDGSIEAMLQEAQRQHPTLRAARARLDQAEAELQQAERSGRPTISALGSGRHARDLAEPRQRAVAIGLQVEIPLFGAAERRARIDRARAQRDSASAGLHSDEREAALTVWKAYQSVREQSAAVQMAERFLHSAQALLTGELASFRQGDSDLFDVIAAHESVQEANAERLSSLSQLSVGRLQLAAALGRLARGGADTPAGRRLLGP